MFFHQETFRFIFGLKLRQYRINKRFSLKELSSKTGLSPSYINEIEKGKKYPRNDKIKILSNVLGIEFDELTSAKLTDDLEHLTKLLNSKVLKNIPIDFWGIPGHLLLEIMSHNPKKFSVLVGLVFELARNLDVKIEDIFFATLRAYLAIKKNYFHFIEEKAIESRKELIQASEKKYIDVRVLQSYLYEFKGIAVRYTDFDRNVYLSKLKHLYIENKKTLYVNRSLSSREVVFILAKELGYIQLQLKERSNSTVWNHLDSFEQLYNNFQASYFASSLIIDKNEFIKKVENIFGKTDFHLKSLENLVLSYSGTYESFFHRLTQVLPKYFGLEHLFFLRFTYDQRKQTYQMTNELHLSELQSPYRVHTHEHYCQRWISISLLNDICGNTKKRGPIFGIQCSNYVDTEKQYLCFSMAYIDDLNPNLAVCVTLGIHINEKATGKIQFLKDPNILIRQVCVTCERCPLTNCKERAADAIYFKEMAEDLAFNNAVREFRDSN